MAIAVVKASFDCSFQYCWCHYQYSCMSVLVIDANLFFVAFSTWFLYVFRNGSLNLGSLDL